MAIDGGNSVFGASDAHPIHERHSVLRSHGAKYEGSQHDPGGKRTNFYSTAGGHAVEITNQKGKGITHTEVMPSKGPNYTPKTAPGLNHAIHGANNGIDKPTYNDE